MKKEKQEGLSVKSVEISCHAPDAGSVFLAGTFNAWDPSACPMKRTAGGMWRATLQLAPGVYEYKFQVDGEWACKPGIDELDPSLLSSSECVPNIHGTTNRRVEVVLSAMAMESIS